MWKVGQLAKRTGISVRTLHHYDQIGLLTPSHRTESGHRLYDRDDVVRMKEVQEEWPRLIEEVRAEMQRGTDVHSPQVQTLAKRWMSLVNEFSGGDAAIETSVANMYRSEPGAAERFGFDTKVFEYIKPA